MADVTQAPATTDATGDEAILVRVREAGLVPGTWSIDPTHSEIAFTVRHLMTRVRGTFGRFSGDVVVAEDPTASTVSVVIETSSFDTGTADRDAHVRSDDFLAVERYPEIRFASTGFRVTGENTFVLSGDLTVKDVTKPIELEAEFLGVSPDHYGQTRAGFEAKGRIDRTDFGVTTNIPVGDKMMIGEQVDIQISVQAVLQSDGS